MESKQAMTAAKAWDLLEEDREDLDRRELLFKEKGVLSDFAMDLARKREAEKEQEARIEAASMFAFIVSG